MQRLYIEEGTAIARELYLSCLVDRETSTVAFIASTEGGMNIEEVAAKTPEKIVTVHVDPAAGYSPFVGRRIAAALKLEGDQVKQCVKMIGQLYQGLHREGHEPARNQSAGGDQGRPARSASMPR